MGNVKTILKSVRDNKKATILSLVFILGEVFLEVLIPYITALLVNRIKEGIDMNYILKMGAIMVAAAVVSLGCGILAGLFSAKASAGVARNLRADVFARIQNFSFANVDKFSSSSLVTRTTTDITNVQNSYMMCIRIAVRAPMMLIFSIIMASIMGGKLALTFAVIIPVLAFGLIMIAKKAMPAFVAVFRKYDKLNESVEENVRGMRVVKGFAREDYEIRKFSTASEDIMKDFTKAERIVALNGPLMQFCLYFNMLFVLFVGSKLVMTGSGIDVGQMSAMITYGVQVLMSLMMISMIYVMLTMSLESIKRLAEVLNEESTITNPSEPVMEVKDGSIDFTDVHFKYSEHAEREALFDIDLHIDSGMTVGVLGGTGSSKTTFVQLIPRLYDVTSGSVKVGGIDVEECPVLGNYQR